MFLCSIHVIDIRIYFYCQQRIREAIICTAIEEVEFVNVCFTWCSVVINMMLNAESCSVSRHDTSTSFKPVRWLQLTSNSQSSKLFNLLNAH
jgi:hypothetical protein